jgi:hypothetical protein
MYKNSTNISVNPLSPSYLGASSVCVPVCMPVPITCHHGITLQLWMRFPKECNWQLKVSQRSNILWSNSTETYVWKKGDEKTIHARDLGRVNESPPISGSNRSALTKRTYVFTWAEAMASLHWMLQHGHVYSLQRFRSVADVYSGDHSPHIVTLGDCVSLQLQLLHGSQERQAYQAEIKNPAFGCLWPCSLAATGCAGKNCI